MFHKNQRNGFCGILHLMKFSELQNNVKQFFSLVRRNHALEHATLHVIAQSHPQIRLAGHSDAEGLYIIGDISTQELYAALEEARQRLQAGEHHLAVHPNCGTNLVISGGLAAIAGALAIRRMKAKSLWEWLDQWAFVMLLGVIALSVAQPLGIMAQERVTTNAELQGLKVFSIVSYDHPLFGKLHRVKTRG